jgi:hypothetical protein
MRFGLIDVASTDAPKRMLDAFAGKGYCKSFSSQDWQLSAFTGTQRRIHTLYGG